MINDFASTVGLPIDGGLWRPPPKNVSPDARKIQFLWRLNGRAGGSWTKRDRWALMQILRPLSNGPKVGASRLAREAFVAQFEKKNRMVASEFLGIDGPRFDHPFPDDAPVALTVDDVLPFVQAIIERRMAWSAVKMGAVSLLRSSEQAVQFLGQWALDNVSAPHRPVLDEQVRAYTEAFEAAAITAGILLDDFEDCALDIPSYIRITCSFWSGRPYSRRAERLSACHLCPRQTCGRLRPVQECPPQ